MLPTECRRRLSATVEEYKRTSVWVKQCCVASGPSPAVRELLVAISDVPSPYFTRSRLFCNCSRKRAEFQVSHVKILVLSPRKLEIFLIAEGRRTFRTFCCIINIAAELRGKHLDGSSPSPANSPHIFQYGQSNITALCVCVCL